MLDQNIYKFFKNQISIDEIQNLSKNDLNKFYINGLVDNIKQSPRHITLLAFFPVVERMLKNNEITLKLIWREYIKKHPDGYKYSHFCQSFSKWCAIKGITKTSSNKWGLTPIDNDDINILKKYPKALGVNADVIRNFNEEATFNIISNNYHDHSSSVNYQFNPIEKIVELYQEKIALYERMLKEKDALIDKLINQK